MSELLLEASSWLEVSARLNLKCLALVLQVVLPLPAVCRPSELLLLFLICVSGFGFDVRLCSGAFFFGSGVGFAVRTTGLTSLLTLDTVSNDLKKEVVLLGVL